ncbi:MAG: hypothetical protein PHQ96_00005, partial [Candidatus Omnitrophica bacterium]|nr:hypothetical protein [Candidatus Omnitrophota bacterium]
ARILKPKGMMLVLEAKGDKFLSRIFRLLTPSEKGLKDNTAEYLLALGAQCGDADIDYIEASFLMRAIGFYLGWPRAIGYLYLPAYLAAFLWEKIYETFTPKNKWAYMLMSVCRR